MSCKYQAGPGSRRLIAACTDRYKHVQIKTLQQQTDQVRQQQFERVTATVTEAVACKQQITTNHWMPIKSTIKHAISLLIERDEGTKTPEETEHIYYAQSNKRTIVGATELRP